MHKKVSTIAGALTGIAIGGVGAILLATEFSLIPQPNSAAPQKTFDLVALLLLISIIHFVNGWATRRKIRQSRLGDQRNRLPLRRPAWAIGTRFLRYQLMLVFIFFVWLRGRSWYPQSVGFKQELPNWLAFASGLFAFLVMLAVLQACFYLAGTINSRADSTMVNMARLWPRKPSQKRAMAIAVCLLNPITEELMYRGILVYQFGLARDGFELPLCLGLVVSLSNHTYQGLGAIALHALFYVVAVGLLLSPAGLLGAIGLHYAGDIFPFVVMGRNLKAYRQRHRRLGPGDA